MSGSDRRKYLTAAAIDQDLLDWCHDNLEIRLEMICEIESPDGTIRLSDRNKYVGEHFYEARMRFPVITRTAGEWLSGEIQFQVAEIELSNVDGKFNSYLPGGSNFEGWVGRSVSVKLGLGETASTYKTIFSGKVTEVGGFKRTTKTIRLTARDDYDFLNDNLPKTVFSVAAYPDIEEANQGKPIPVIYGDWTTGLDPDKAAVPAYVLNGNNASVTASPWANVQLRVASHALKAFETAHVYLQRSDAVYQVDSGKIKNLSLATATFELEQGGSWLKDSAGAGISYEFQQGDTFFVRVKGKDLGAYSDNLVAQAKDLLQAFDPQVTATFHANWETFRDKASPAESAVSLVKSRVWIGEQIPRLQYVLSMLEQVRLEAFIDRDRKIKLLPLHTDSFSNDPSIFQIKNWDVVRGSFELSISDEKNSFNRGQAAFDYRPNRNENAKLSPVFRNAAAITQQRKSVAKKVVFPNLYIESDVSNQFKEILKLSSSGFEIVTCSLTWRAMLLDIGDFVRLNVKIGSTQFEEVPCMIRDIGYDPEGLKVVVKMWSLQMVPFGSYLPNYDGTVGGQAAVITAE